ncbi:dipeptide epimerase [Candidatus Bathyarchaeota archaeon]|nr:dipeptide epimerase [Candidatus Bathyarchaeota archaeon]
MSMKIIRAMAIPVELQLKEPFAIANETIEVADNILIRLETETGIIGWGCSTPDAVTSETKETVLRNFEVAKRLVIGCDPTRINLVNFALDSDIKGNSSLKAGINMALYDIIGKIAGIPLFRLLGGYRDRIATSVTIGLNNTNLMVKKAKQIVSDGFKFIKIKCGIDVDEDIENILAIREAVGSSIKLRLDANEGYSVEEALKIVKTLEENGVAIEMLEQPTKAKYLYSLKDVARQCSVPIMADETALTLRDSFKLVRLEIADMINIKLMKIGGITNSIKANALAELADVPVMVGCMNESMVAMSAGVHFACAFRNVEYADLDSALDFTNDVAKGGARYEDGYVIPSERPGLGVEVQL